MSREIKFRGQTRRKGERIINMAGDKCEANWVYGGIFPQNDSGDFAIIYQQVPTIDKFSVYADTVGQYTGIEDKNGKEIYDGDIVKLPAWITNHGDYAVCKFTDLSSDTYPIIGFAFFDLKGNLVDSDEWDEYEVVGNVYENPELLQNE